MLRGRFELNGLYSEALNTWIEARPKIKSAVRVIEAKEVPGLSRSMIIDKKYYKNVDVPLTCYAKATSMDDIQHLQDQIATWFDMFDYVEFKPYWDPEYIWLVYTSSFPEFAPSRKDGLSLPFTATLSAQPFKYSRLGRISKEFTQTFEIINPENYASAPMIRIVGKGDVTISINNRNLVIKNIEDEIQLDCEEMEIFRNKDGLLINQANKMNSNEFPYLDPGTNNVTWIGNIQKIIIEPRWRTKL